MCVIEVSSCPKLSFINIFFVMENQRNIQSANFDLVNTYFGIDVVHTYDGICVTAYRVVSIPTLLKPFALLLSFYPGSIMDFIQRMVTNMATKRSAPHRFPLVGNLHVTEFFINLLFSNYKYTDKKRNVPCIFEVFFER